MSLNTFRVLAISSLFLLHASQLAAQSSSNAAASAESPSHPAGGNAHIVARGETLTSIAKMYKVSVDELQKANHIEDGRKLQAGQTIMIPAAQPAAPSASPSSAD